MVEIKDIDRALAAFLLENILKKQDKPTYSEIAKALSKQLGRKVNPHYNLELLLPSAMN